jgi:hypothetical protein
MAPVVRREARRRGRTLAHPRVNGNARGTRTATPRIATPRIARSDVPAGAPLVYHRRGDGRSLRCVAAIGAEGGCVT